MTHTQRCQNLLIVEDDADIRETLEEALKAEGFRVSTAANGKEALELLTRTPDSWKPCFILLDLMMPVMNGWEFLLIQQNDPKLRDIPIMVCSAVAERSKLPHIVSYIQKPIDLDLLISHIRKHCDHDSTASAHS